MILYSIDNISVYNNVALSKMCYIVVQAESAELLYTKTQFQSICQNLTLLSKLFLLIKQYYIISCKIYTILLLYFRKCSNSHIHRHQCAICVSEVVNIFILLSFIYVYILWFLYISKCCFYRFWYTLVGYYLFLWRARVHPLLTKYCSKKSNRPETFFFTLNILRCPNKIFIPYPIIQYIKIFWWLK